MSEKPPKIRIDQRKLGRERAYGYYHPPRKKGADAVIEIDPRQSPEEELDTLIHEAIHHAYPFLSEDAVESGASKIRKICWTYGYRKVVLEETKKQ